MAALSARRRAPGARACATSSSHNAHPPPSYPPGGAADGSGTAAAVAAAGLLRPTPRLRGASAHARRRHGRRSMEGGRAAPARARRRQWALRHSARRPPLMRLARPRPACGRAVASPARARRAPKAARAYAGEGIGFPFGALGGSGPAKHAHSSCQCVGCGAGARAPSQCPPTRARPAPSPVAPTPPPPIPTSLADVDAGNVLGYGAELAPDHPVREGREEEGGKASDGARTAEVSSSLQGFHDAAYKRRRAHLASLAAAVPAGAPPPRVRYSASEATTWATVLDSLASLHPDHACTEYNECAARLGFTRGVVPQLADVSAVLTPATGFSIRAVAGMMHPRAFLAGLAFKCFHSTQYVRHGGRPDYTPEPDLCHELIGHAPLLLHPPAATMVHAIGVASLGASDADVWRLTKVGERGAGEGRQTAASPPLTPRPPHRYTGTRSNSGSCSSVAPPKRLARASSRRPARWCTSRRAPPPSPRLIRGRPRFPR